MKKLLTFVSGLMALNLIFFSLNVKAFTSDPSSGDYSTDSTVTINLLANPQGTENAVSVGLIAEGMTIINYNPPSADGWIGNTPDCSNSQFYSENSVCTSMAKTTPIVAGESLGTITVKITGGTYAKLTKTSDNSYSDGQTIRDDGGVLVEFNKANQGSSSSNASTSLITNLQPLLIIAAVVVILVLGIILLFPIIKKKLAKSQISTPSSTTPFQ